VYELTEEGKEYLKMITENFKYNTLKSI